MKTESDYKLTLLEVFILLVNFIIKLKDLNLFSRDL